ncbi:MAG: hypothetical protein EBS84_21365, partial [Proteobacteria bacterium]|nr:hypothetical protein [Pseudomonadota bacterium]
LLKHGTLDHDFHRGRDQMGRLTQCCALCGFTRVVLAEDAIVGPAHYQVPDMGARLTKAKRVTRDNVTPWKVSQR